MATLRRFFDHHQITRRKTIHASEQDCAHIVERRWAWFKSQLDLDPEGLVFSDETWAQPTWRVAMVDADAASGSAPA